MKRKLKTITSLSLVSVMALSGCSAVYDYSNIPSQQPLTKQEVIDYYAEEMSYDAIVNRSMKKDDTINWNNVPSVVAEQLWNETLKVIETHQLNAGFSGDMSASVHDWLKLSIDDLVLTKPNGQYEYTSLESQGYYFVTVPFETHLNGAGTMKNEANYLGINGVIIQDQNENPVIDESFLTSALIKMNADREARGLKPYQSFGVDLNYVRETQATVEETLPETDAEGNVIIGRDDETSESSENETTTQAETETAPETLADFGNNHNEYVPQTTQAEEGTPYRNLYANNIESRQLEYDVVDFNNKVGTSMEQMAAVPYLGMIYNPVEPNGEISGYGVFQEGNYGLRDFGYSRDSYPGGTIKITFVFKQDPDDREKINYSYCYINSYESGINLNKTHMDEVPNNEGVLEEVEVFDEVILSDAINEEIDKVIERADRAINNKDTAALMSKDIFEGSDLGIKYAVWRNSTNLLTFMTKRVRTLERKDEDSRMYLVELERTTEESPKGFGNTGKYKDKLYAVIRQQGQHFRINDIVLASRELQRIPEPDADSSIVRRLTSLNLAGDVTEQARQEIGDMMSTFYYSIDQGIVKDEKGNDGSIILRDGQARYGFYDRFDSDNALLNSDRRDYLQSQIVARKLKETNKYPASMRGEITEWLGGYNDLVEFTTRELYGYEDLNRGVYVENYYLVSHYGTEWVIDDIVVMKEEEVSGDTFAQYRDTLEATDLGKLTKERVAGSLNSAQ